MLIGAEVDAVQMQSLIQPAHVMHDLGIALTRGPDDELCGLMHPLITVSLAGQLTDIPDWLDNIGQIVLFVRDPGEIILARRLSPDYVQAIRLEGTLRSDLARLRSVLAAAGVPPDAVRFVRRDPPAKQRVLEAP